MTNLLAYVQSMRRSLKFDKEFLTWMFKFAAIIFVFFIFVFPAQRELNAVSTNLKLLKNQITDIKKISTNLLTPEELKEIESRLKEFESKLIDSSQASALLDFITDEADKNHFHVIQVYSDSPIVIKNETGKELESEGKKLLWLPINFRVETDFKSLGNFLKSLKDEAKGNFLLESLILEKTSTQAESLQCDIALSFVAK